MFNTLKISKIGQFFSRYFSEKCEICQPRLFDFESYKYLKFIDTSLLVHTEYYEEDTRMIKWLIKSLRNSQPITFVIRILGNCGNNNGMYEGNYKDLLSSTFAKDVVRNINNSHHYVYFELNTISWDITSWFGRGNKKDFICPPKRFKQICFKKIKYLKINLNNRYYFPNFSKFYSFTNYCYLESLTIVVGEHFEEELTLDMLKNLLKTLKNVSCFKELTITNKNEFGQSYIEHLAQHIPLNVKKLIIDGYIIYSNIILQSITTRCPLIEHLVMGKPIYEQSLPSLFFFSLTKLKYLSFWCFEEDIFHIPITCIAIKIECYCSWSPSEDIEYTCIRKLLKYRYPKLLQIVDQNNIYNGKFIYFNKTEDCLILKN
uniref:F-box domain-containing protein n=1 Tax=Strongyloides papillosus TaxID=174720 RepID=A0A0N5BNI7_STREA